METSIRFVRHSATTPSYCSLPCLSRLHKHDCSCLKSWLLRVASLWLTQLILLVGKLAVEQAALTVAHSETRGLAHGWLEYFDSHSRAPYFYNVRSK
eukprot:5284173-Pleurochrysis_carterae.AAC.1